MLKCEQPQKVKFRLQNVSDKQITLQVQLGEGLYSHECLITECEPAYLGNIDPNKWTEFTLHLFPKKCGIVNLSGIVIINVTKPRVDPYDYRK